MSSIRFLAAVVASLLLVATAVALDRAPRTDASDQVGAASPAPPEVEDAAPSPGAADPSSPTSSPGEPAPSTQERLALLTSTDAAEEAGAEALLEAGLRTAQREWRTLGDPAWPVRDERPVYVAEAAIADGAEAVEADVVIAWRPAEDADRIVLRALAASAVLQRNGGELEATVELDGEEVEFESDADGARIVIPAPVREGEAHLVRIRVAYDLVGRAGLDGTGGPAGFGLLFRDTDANGETPTANLGHWLPLLTFDPGPMVPWGDVGAFPPAIWSAIVDHGGSLVTGGTEDPCPGDGERESVSTCTWARGLALRDLSAVWFADTPSVETEEVGQLVVNTVAADGAFSRAINQQALLESVGSVEVFAEAFGPLAWREFDVVAAPLLEGAAGMEFPGLVIIDTDIYDALEGQLGTYVIAHEAGHQWFHALVGNSSLDSPVIDESVAQYLSVLFYAAAYGDAAGERFAEGAIRDRYVGARQRGLEDEPPAQPLGEFAGDSAYSPLVYARAPLAWLAAEERLGRGAVIAFLSEVVDRYGLDHVSDDELLDAATAFDPELGEILDRYWFDPAPVIGQSS